MKLKCVVPNNCNLGTKAIPNKIRYDSNTAMGAFPKEILNDCDVPTEMIPNEFEYVQHMDCIANPKASRETGEIITKRWWPICHIDGYHCRMTLHRNLIERIARSSTVTSDSPRRLLNSIVKDPNYRQIAYQTKCQTSLARGLPNDCWEANGILPMITTEIAIDGSTKNAPMPTSKWRSQRTGLLRPYLLLNQGIARFSHAMYQAFIAEQNSCRITVSMTTYCDTYMLDIDQWYSTHAQCNWRQFCHLRLVTVNAVCKWQLWYQEGKLTSLSEVMTWST